MAACHGNKGNHLVLKDCDFKVHMDKICSLLICILRFNLFFFFLKISVHVNQVIKNASKLNHLYLIHNSSSHVIEVVNIMRHYEGCEYCLLVISVISLCTLKSTLCNILLKGRIMRKLCVNTVMMSGCM